MHDQLRHDLSQAIEAMSEQEKLQLIEELTHSLRTSGEDATSRQVEGDVVERQKRAWREVMELSMRNPNDEPDDGITASRDHDRVLYDGSNKLPEKPTK